MRAQLERKLPLAPLTEREEHLDKVRAMQTLLIRTVGGWLVVSTDGDDQTEILFRRPGMAVTI